MRASKALIRLALLGVVGALIWAVIPAAATNPVQLTYTNTADGSFWQQDNGDPVGVTTRGCSVTNPDFGGLLTASGVAGTRPADVGLFDGGIGVKGKGSNGTPCSQVEFDNLEQLTLASGATPWDGAELDLELKGNAKVEIVLSGGSLGEESVVFAVLTGGNQLTGTYVAQTDGSSATVVSGSDGPPYSLTLTRDEPFGNCADPQDSGSDNQFSDNCRLILKDLGFAFQSLTIIPLEGSVSLEGGGDFGVENAAANNTRFFYASPPKVFVFEVSIPEDSISLPLGVLVGAENTDVSTISVVDQSLLEGTVVASGGDILYSADAEHFNGDAGTFKYSVSSPEGVPLEVTVNVSIDAVNDAPTASAGSASTLEDSSTVIDLSGLVSDVDLSREGDSLTILDPDGLGTEFTVDGQSITYNPPSNFFGQRVVTYTVQDAAGESASADITINVSEVNDAPVERDLSDLDLDLTEDTDVTRVFCVAQLATDPDNEDSGASNDDDLTISGTRGSGTLIVSGDGTCVTYTLPADFWGEDTITLTVSDNDEGDPLTIEITLILDVEEVNDDPVANPDAAVVNENRTYNSGTAISDFSVQIPVLANDTDPDDSDGVEGNESSLTVVSFTQGTWGSVTEVGGVLVYTPNVDASLKVGFDFSDQFSYTVGDGYVSPEGTSSTTVDISLRPIQCENETKEAGDIETVYGSFTMFSSNACKTYFVDILGEEDPALNDDRVLFQPNSAGESNTGTAVYTGELRFPDGYNLPLWVSDSGDSTNTMLLPVYDPDGDGAGYVPLPACNTSVPSEQWWSVIPGNWTDGADADSDPDAPPNGAWCLLSVSAEAVNGTLRPIYYVFGVGDPLFRIR